MNSNPYAKDSWIVLQKKLLARYSRYSYMISKVPSFNVRDWDRILPTSAYRSLYTSGSGLLNHIWGQTIFGWVKFSAASNAGNAAKRKFHT